MAKLRDWRLSVPPFRSNTSSGLKRRQAAQPHVHVPVHLICRPLEG